MKIHVYDSWSGIQNTVGITFLNVAKPFHSTETKFFNFCQPKPILQSFIAHTLYI